MPKTSPQDSTKQETAAPLIAESPGFDPIPPLPSDPLDPKATKITEADSWPEQEPDRPSPSIDEPTGPSSTIPTTGSSPGSSAEVAQLTEILGAGFELAGVSLHERITPGENDCWIPRPGERDLVAGALARIAVRHMPKGMAASSDLGDAVTAAVGVALYGLSNALRTPVIRANVHVGPGESAPTVDYPGGDAAGEAPFTPRATPPPEFGHLDANG